MSDDPAVTQDLKWPEVYSLAALNAAVVISWIAYHEYQPVLIEKFNFSGLVDFLIVTKAIVLVVIPPIAGLVADHFMRKNGKYFTIFTIGIGTTAMIFMIVATIIGSGPVSAIRPLLPVMIVLWLIAMNVFISPANSMIEAFAPAQKLPIVMGVLFLVTELIYAVEPIIVELVRFFGDTLTFIVGGLLIAGTGFLFHRVSSDEVIQRKQQRLASSGKTSQNFISFLVILLIGTILGTAKAFLVEFFPGHAESGVTSVGAYGQYISFGLLGFSAILGFLLSRRVVKLNLLKVIVQSTILMVIGILLMVFTTESVLLISGGVLTAVAFSMINISGLPYVINHLSIMHLTYGVGIFIGASEIVTGLMEVYLY
ncbi:MAG: hypothetical protein AAGA85_03780 [Bacteroidota bacterium]